MAVYKSTFCYPFLNNIDIRTVSNDSDKPAIQWLKCKVNTSNKNVTGYKVRILDNNNNQIFPLGDGKISPVSELEGRLPEGAEINDNTGINGTFLYIPFFQNINTIDRLHSYSSIYFDARYYADYYIPSDDIGNWYTVDGGEHYYNNTSDWGKNINGEICSLGEYVCLESNSSYSLYEITDSITLTRVDSLGDNEKILIMKGEYRGLCLQNGTGSVSVNWTDVEGHNISLSSNFSLYKWEITLYQGTPDTEPVGEPKEISYNALPDTWFDQVLTSGTILGSTSKRIQIAKDFTGEWKIPSTSVNNPLVLQGKWVELLDSNNQKIKNRAYIQNYDTTLGHVYPKTGYFTAQDIADASFVRFYSLSNNPSEILASDTAVCATTEDITIYEENYSDFATTPTDILIIDGWSLSQGERVLVMNQISKEENGIYTYNGPGQKWSRSGGCETWGSLIGKKIFVANGSENGGKNFQSQAFAGGSLLFANNSRTNASGSPLYWQEEQPILLYDTDAERVQFFEIESNPQGSIEGETSIDGIDLTVGDKVYWIHVLDQQFYSSIEGKLCTYLGNGNFSIEALVSGKMYKIEKGKKAGNIYKYSDYYFNAITPDYSLYTVNILKNTRGEAFVSPFIGLEKGQKIKFTNVSVGTPATQWIKINDIDKNIWKISYDSSDISEPFPSEDESGVKNNIPYKYEVRTFFNSSDENPFNIYEQPYLNINCQFGPFNYDSVNERQITLEGEYIQSQQVSWESYRWILYNHKGEIIQDSGKQHDKEMKVSFYGLNNEQSESQNHYTIILTVEDAIGNIVSKEIPIIVSYPLGEDTIVQLIGKYNCENQSIELSIVPEKEVDLVGDFEAPNYPKKIDGIDINSEYSVLNLNDNKIYKYISEGNKNIIEEDWAEKRWEFEGGTPTYEEYSLFSSTGIWKNKGDIYFSYKNFYIGDEYNYLLDPSTYIWKKIQINWSPVNPEEARYTWEDIEGNTYISHGNTQLQFWNENGNRHWAEKAWYMNNGSYDTRFYPEVSNIWSDGEYIFYSNNSEQYVLLEGKWYPMTWLGPQSNFNLGSGHVWRGANHTYWQHSSNPTYNCYLDSVVIRENTRRGHWTLIDFKTPKPDGTLTPFYSNLTSAFNNGQHNFAWGGYYSDGQLVEEGYYYLNNDNIWIKKEWPELSPNDDYIGYWKGYGGELYYNTEAPFRSNGQSLKMVDYWLSTEQAISSEDIYSVKQGKEYGNHIYQGQELLLFSIYRREKDLFDNGQDREFYIGEWHPVVVNSNLTSIQDFNIKADYSYEYILYSATSQISVTSLATKEIKDEAEQIEGDIYRITSQYWSISELKPIAGKDPLNPIVEKQYEVDLDNIWLFKFEAEIGSQTQNFTKNEINSLGIYPKVGFGIKNYLSGDITCLLGDEIIPYSSEGYIERLRSGIKRPLSTNEKTRMLNKWREMAYSRNPKLLKDNKGQSWVVQIFSSSNTPYSHYINQPDKISFSWKQIGLTENCVIYGKGGDNND